MAGSSRWLAPATVAAVLVGCSSDPPPTPAQPPGTLSSGTTVVSIDGRGAGTDENVACQTIGTTTTVNTGDEQAGTSVVISSGANLVVESVIIRNLGGFSGSYNNDLSEPAKVDLTDRTYDVSGVADGFDIDKPSFRKQAKFSIMVAC